MADVHSFIPTVLWAQRNNILYITINVEDCKNPAITLDENSLHFKGKGGTEKHEYEVTIDFFKAVVPTESKKTIQDRFIFFVIKKKEEGPFWPQLLKGAKKAHWLKTDFNKWKDEDDSDDDDKDMNFEDMMNSMGGMDGADNAAENLDDSDDEDLPDLE
ncbi:hypothetical protein ACJMK2_023202 [Sinanodonta woodiana]|uniref:CS domain-containing protein n=1 Tax=Sinanodonta woodiana TaxID=1069815 RepID=A0ABD3T3H2_SINWO